MQLMCDAVSVLGSRHGILWDTTAHECRLIRFDACTDCPRFQLRAGIIINGEEIMLPLAHDGEACAFLDLCESGTDTLDITFTQRIDATAEPLPQRDRQVVTQGTRIGRRVTRHIPLHTGEPQEALEIAWCTHSAPALQIHGTCYPFI